MTMPDSDSASRAPRSPPAALAWLQHLGSMVAFGVIALVRIPRISTVLAALVEQMVSIGARSAPVVAISGGFIGMVVAVQFHETLVRFGSVSLLGSAVGLTLIRELGPLVTALMVIARAGSASSAELAIMRTGQQIDALECMAIDPVRFLVLPRWLAFVLSLPLLVAMFVIVGFGGGYLVGVVGLGVGSGTYWSGLQAAMVPIDLLMCLAKAITFGVIIAWVCLAKGFLIHLTDDGQLGAAGVSRTTTDAVVFAALMVLFSDYVISAALT